MESGFPDGANAELLERGPNSPLGAGVFVTAVRAQAPGVDAAVRLVDTANAVCGLGVDAAPLEAFAVGTRRRYEDLAERIEEREPESGDDRVYT